MVDLHELEQRWLRYKIKYYLPHFAVTISIIVITSTLIIYNKNFSKEIRKKETKKKQIEKKVALQTSIPIKKRIKKRIKKKTPSQRPIRSIAINKKAVVHSPSLDIMKKSPTQMQPHNKDKNISTQDKKSVKDTIQREQTNTLTPVETPLQKEEPHHISIIKKDTHNDIVEIIQRFNKNNNPALSLFIAEKYYALGNYRQSRHYALITNNLNKDIELSWIIFTKSLVKLGERKKAIQTLQKYLEYNHSNRVQTLLNKIRSGKLK